MLCQLIILKNFHGQEYIIKADNKFKNKRVSLIFEKNQIKLSRHLAFIEQAIDNIPNWKKLGFKDMPINAFSNDGLIINGDQNILTKGNNEVIINENLELTLYRSVGMLGKAILKTRPGVASGLPFKHHTPNAQLQKELSFNISINKNNSIQAFNEWNFSGLGIFGGNVNPTLNKLDRFVWNRKKLKKWPLIKMKKNIQEILIGRLKWNYKINIIFSKPNDEIKKGKIYYK